MTAEGNAVQDRLGETTDHATSPSPSPGQRAGSPFPPAEGRGTPFVYASGARPLAGYTIKRGVGSGGFGEVYYAVSDAGKDVALKLIRRNLDTELRGMRQCLNLKHPNLLSLYDIRVDDSGDTWIVMEYVSGKSLEAVLAEHPQGLPVDEALAWFRGIAAGVAYLHDHGIVHRDLKPGNIFSDEGIVKVGDYGLSKFISCSRRSGHTESIGTVHYMAPEVAHGRYGKELDIYALGAVLYELVTGRVPFDGESVGEVLMKHLTAQPDVSGLAEPYRTVVARALDKDPAKRFATVGQMLAAVECGAGTQFAGSSPLSHVTLDSPRQAEEKATASPRAPKAEIPHAIPVAQPAPAEAAEILNDRDREPIARAVRKAFADLRRDWQNSKLRSKLEQHYYLKVLFVFLGVCMLLPFTPWLLGVAAALAVLYGVYLVGRRIYLWLFAPKPLLLDTALRKELLHGVSAAGAVGGTAKVALAFIVKPRLVRVRELIGSMLISTGVAAAACVVAMLITVYNKHSSAQPEQCAWLFLVGLAGAWIVLVTGKFWEGREEEHLLRRFNLMVLGLGLGFAAYGLADHFRVRLQPDEGLMVRTGLHLQLPPDFYRDGQPQPMAYMAAFATLMALVRWWRQSDPLRQARLSLISLIVTVIAAHIVAIAWQFPEPWLMMVAGCMSVSVQLASPWVPAHARLKPQRKKVI